MKYYYKDRDFPEVKTSNADVVAAIENPTELQRVIDDHNMLVDRILDLERIAIKALDKIADACQCETDDRDVCYYTATKALTKLRNLK
jgi:hypothetical protein